MPDLIHPYASEAYARAFEGLAQPVALPALGAWALARGIPGTAQFDLAGCYPLTALRALGDLGDRQADFDRLGAQRFVSLVLVADAFSGASAEVLHGCFDIVRPFKTHYAHDYGKPFAYARHHRYEVKLARAALEVRPTPLAHVLAQWNALYATLVARHRIEGLQRFSPQYFERLAALPALHALAASDADGLVGMHLFLEHDGIVYSHLAAISERGYRLRAGYALNDAAIEHFRGRRLIDFGAGAGAADDVADGLAIFKRGFANRTERFHLCGKVLDRPAYAQLSAAAGETNYFPAYRAASV